MCGITGIIGQAARNEKISQMLESQKHRGPDFMDFYCEPNQAALGHNRLSIIDLSSNATSLLQVIAVSLLWFSTARSIITSS